MKKLLVLALLACGTGFAEKPLRCRMVMTDKHGKPIKRTAGPWHKGQATCKVGMMLWYNVAADDDAYGLPIKLGFQVKGGKKEKKVFDNWFQVIQRELRKENQTPAERPIRG